MAAFLVQWQHYVMARDTIWTSKPKILTTRPFAIKLANSSSRERGDEGFGDRVWPFQVGKHKKR